MEIYELYLHVGFKINLSGSNALAEKIVITYFIGIYVATLPRNPPLLTINAFCCFSVYFFPNGNNT